MTEMEWVECQEPAKMLGHVSHGTWRYSNDRLRRLWCAAVLDARDGKHPETARLIAWRQGQPFHEEPATELDQYVGGLATLGASPHRPGWPPLPVRADLLREIWGNPWQPVNRRLPAADFSRCSCGSENRNRSECGACGKWLPRTDMAAVLSIAQTIYDEQRWEELPVLWDALSDSGCTDEAIRVHLCQTETLRPCWRCKGKAKRDVVHDGGRQQGRREITSTLERCEACGGEGYSVVPVRHVRGCFVLDLVLGFR